MKSTRRLDTDSQQPNPKRFRADEPINYLINNIFNHPDEGNFEKLLTTLLKTQVISISLLESIIGKAATHFKQNPNAINSASLDKIISFSVENIIQQLHPSLGNQTEDEIYNIDSIRHLFYHLGVLAKSGVKFPSLPSDLIQLLLNDYLNVRVENYCHTGNFLISGLGQLAKFNKIDGMIDSSQLQSLLMIVNDNSGTNDFALAHGLYGVGLLAESNLIQGSIKSSILESIMDQLSSCRDISNGMYGCALLAENDNVNGMISTNCLNQALHHCHLQPKKNGQDIANIILSLGKLASNDKIQGKINPYDFLDLIQSIPLSHYQNRHLIQIWQGMSLTAKHNNHDLVKHIPVKLIHQLAELIIHKHKYLHPTNAAIFIAQLPAFTIYSKELNDIFKQVINALTVPLHRLANRHQVSLQSALVELKSTCPSWHTMLSARLYPAPKKSQASNVMDIEHADNHNQRSLSSNKIALKINKPTPLNTAKINLTLKSTLPQPLPAIKNTTTPIKPKRITTSKQNHIRDLIENKDLRGLSALLNTKESHPVTTLRQPQQHDKQLFKKLLKAKVTQEDTFSKEAIVVQFFKDTPASILNELASKSSHIYFDLLINTCSPHTRYQLFITQTMHPILLNLSMKELSSFIEKLISPIMIYRDHHAILRIYDALAIRAAMEPDHKKSLNIIATNLVNIAVEFHDRCEHPHVIERLQGLSDLDKWILQEDLKIIDISKTVESTAKMVLPTTVAPSKSNAIPFASKSITTLPTKTSLNQQNTVNVDYQYDTEDIEAILRARINQGLSNGTLHGSINVLASVQLHHLVPGNKVEDVLTDFLQSNQRNHNGTALLPIQINAGHWIGLKLEIQENHICKIIYFNSSLNVEADKHRCKIFFDALNSADLLHKNANLHAIDIALNCMQQDDDTSCGAYMIENLYCALKHAQWDMRSDLTSQIRNRHLCVLHDENSNYYRTFFTKQNANINTVPSLMTQLVSHQILPSVPTMQGLGMFNQAANSSMNVAHHKDHFQENKPVWK